MGDDFHEPADGSSLDDGISRDEVRQPKRTTAGNVEGDAADRRGAADNGDAADRRDAADHGDAADRTGAADRGGPPPGERTWPPASQDPEGAQKTSRRVSNNDHAGGGAAGQASAPDASESSPPSSEPEQGPSRRGSQWPRWGSWNPDARSETGSESEARERVIPDAVKRLLELGLDRFGDRPDQLRQRLAELRLPKEAWAAILAQLDDRKSGLYRLVAKEVRDLLQNTNFVEDFAAALTKLSFEIKTEVRFVPNQSGSAKPNVSSRVRVRTPESSDDDQKNEDNEDHE